MDISKDSIVWHEGLEKPVEASEVEGLKNIINITPPPLHPIPPLLDKEYDEQIESTKTEESEVENNNFFAAANEVEKKEEVASISTVEDNKKGSRGGIAVLILVVLAIGGVVIYANSNNYMNDRNFENAVNATIYKREVDQQKEKYRNNIGRYLNPHPNNYRKDLVFGGISDLAIKMDNKTPYTLDNVAVEVYYYKANGGLHKTEIVYFKNIGAGKRQIIGAPSSAKGVEVQCIVRSVTSYELGI